MPNQLSTGPDLPYPIRGTAMASSPDGNGVILFGGNNWPYSQLHFTASSPLDTILELRSNGQGWASSWTTLTTKLKHPREYHVVIPVVMDIDTCGINGIVSSNTSKFDYTPKLAQT